MKIVIDGAVGELASRPVDAIEALRDAAAKDGADPEEWLAKALSGHGAVLRAVQVSGEPRYRPVGEFTDEILRVYAIALDSMKREIAEVLEREAPNASPFTQGSS